MFQILRKVMLFSATLAVEPKIISSSQDEKKSLCRPSELPIYPEQNSSEKDTEEHDDTEEAVLQYMENIFTKTHKKYSDICEDINVATKHGIESYEKTIENVESMYNCKFLV